MVERWDVLGALCFLVGAWLVIPRGRSPNPPAADALDSAPRPLRVPHLGGTRERFRSRRRTAVMVSANTATPAVAAGDIRACAALTRSSASTTGARVVGTATAARFAGRAPIRGRAVTRSERTSATSGARKISCADGAGTNPTRWWLVQQQGLLLGERLPCGRFARIVGAATEGQAAAAPSERRRRAAAPIAARARAPQAGASRASPRSPSRQLHPGAAGWRSLPTSRCQGGERDRSGNATARARRPIQAGAMTARPIMANCTSTDVG